MYIPDRCYCLNNMTINPKTKVGEVTIVKALEKGYYKTNMFATQEQVDDMNLEQFDVSPNIAKAMETASMFGWDVYLNVLESFPKESDA